MFEVIFDLETKKFFDETGNFDPSELGVSIVDLGLVYKVRFSGGRAEIEMTLTSPGCPLAPIIDQEVKKALKKVKEVEKIKLELVWEPPWTQEMMSEEVKAEFGI